MTRTSYFGLKGHLGEWQAKELQGLVFSFSSFLSFGESYLLLQVLVKDTAVSLDWSGEAPWASIEQS